MDHSAISYFEQKFGAFDDEELGDLVSRRSDLSDEAIEALNRVLARKGLKDADVFAAPQPKPSRTATEEKQDVEAQTKRARALARWVIPICIRKENKARSRRQCCSTARRSNAVIVFNANWN